MGRFLFASLGLLVMALSLRGVKGSCCPHDWLPINVLCYKVFEEQKNWTNAEMFCKKHKPGCHLASIHSQAQTDDLAEYITDYLINKTHVWIGLHDPHKNNTWEWTDKSKTDYLSWGNNQPDHYENKEFCVEIVDHTGYRLWNDQDCTALRPFLCQCRY